MTFTDTRDATIAVVGALRALRQYVYDYHDDEHMEAVLEECIETLLDSHGINVTKVNIFKHLEEK